MNRLRRLLVLGLLLLLVACGSHDPGTGLDSDQPFINLTPSALIWHDAQGDRTLAHWQQSFSTAKSASPDGPGFAWVDRAQMPLGRRSGALWVAVPLDNPQAALLRHLVVGPARLELVDAWLLSGPAGRDVQPLGRSGLSVPLALRPLPTSTIAWALNLPPGSSTLLLRIQSRTALQPQISLWHPNAHAREEHMVNLHEGLQVGGLALATLLALVFALWLREATWVWYSVATASMLVYQSCFSGQAVLWLWPEHPQWTLPIMAAALACSHGCSVMFTLRFIPDRFIPRWGRTAALGLAGLSLLGFLGVLVLGFQIGIGLQNLAALLLPFMLPWLAWAAWRQGDTASRFMLPSYVLLCVASLLRVSVIYGWLSTNFWLENWLLPLAATLTSAFLMLAMADRVRTQRKQQLQEAQHYQVTLKNDIQAATRELVLARDEAQAAVQFKQRFLSRVSHDLRTPLNILLGNAELARHALDQLTSVGPAVEQARLVASLDAMERSGNDILQLTDELLELARGEVGYLRLVTAPTDLLQLVQGLAHSTRWLALHQNNQLQLVTDLAWPHVALDATRLVQVLRNLLANACAATHNGIITLGLRSTPAVEAGHAQLDVWVSDTGRGMAPEVLGRIFEPFEQVDMASATGSSGLGLAIARQWVRLMGSEIGVQSSQGQGSTFFWSMQVPVAETVAAAVNANPLPAATAARQPHHPDSLDWAQLRTLADSGDGLGVDAWITRHRHQLSDDPLAQGVLALGESLQLAALVRWLDSHHKPL